MSPQVGGWLVVVGVGLVVLGILASVGALSWVGRLPGDLRYESEKVSFYAPITSMLLLSVALSGLAWLFRRVAGG